MLEKIEAQIKELAQKLESSAANHNYMIGAKAALEGLYATMKADAPAVEAVVSAINPAAGVSLDAAVNTTEAVVNAVE